MSGFYKVETHAHTKEVSSCGHLDAETLIRLYAEKEYSTVFITDHYYSPFFKKMEMKRMDALKEYKKGYEAAKVAGEKYGVCVLQGIELRLDSCPNDYLIYGLTDTFLVSNTEIFGLEPEALSALVHQNGGFIVQAHPTRMTGTYPTPAYVDAFEVHNANPRHAGHTDYELGNALAEEHNLFKTGGSDTHRTEDVGAGGMIFPFPITSVSAYIKAVKEGKGEIL